MKTERMEAFSDGVVAIVITIMVLELKPPAQPTPAAIRLELPVYLAYVLSYVNVGLYWANHHHMMQAARHVDGRALWANLFLLFWLSLVPLVIRWMDAADFAALPTAAYGLVLGMAGVGYALLRASLIAADGSDSLVAQATGADRKGKASVALYVIATPLAFLRPSLAIGLYVLIAGVWLVPDRRIERQIGRKADR